VPGGLTKDGGINFTRKKNFEEKKEELEVEEPKVEELEIDEEYEARQARLEAKLVTAKTINYGGFAINGSTIGVMLFGVHNVMMDPNTLETVNLIESTFGMEIPYESFIETIENWKAQIISLCGSVQMFSMYYQQTRQRMKNADTEDAWAFMKEELNKL